MNLDISGFDWTQLRLDNIDVGVLVWYGGICAVLAAAAPALGSPFLRLIAGALVGVVAVSLLPQARANLGF
jgi:hypothetical protein